MTPMMRAPHKLPGLVLEKLSSGWSRRRDQSMIELILPRIPLQQDAPHPALWKVQRIEWPKWSRTGVTVALVGPEDEPPRVVLKLPHTEMGIESLRRQQSILQVLRMDSRLNAIKPLLPGPLAEGVVHTQFYTVEEALPGRSGEYLMFEPQASVHLQKAATVVRQLHEATTTSVRVDATRLERWVAAPARIVRRATIRLPRPTYYAAITRQLEDELHGALAGRMVDTGWIHGDFWPGNLLVQQCGEIVGVVDWERSMSDELALHDLMHLLLFTRKQVHKWGEADVIAAMSKSINWSPEERTLLEDAQEAMPCAPVDERTAVLLYWLRHTAATLALLPEYAYNRDYLADNIEAVLRRL